MFMFFLASTLAVSMVQERQTGTMRRLLSAPIPRSRILLGKLLPYFLIGAVQMTVVLVLSRLLFGIDLGGSWIGILMLIFASALAMAGLGILISAFARSEGQADGLAIILVLTMAVVSGAMFPGIQIAGVQMAAPHYWAMQGFLNVLARGMGPQGVFLPVGILVTMAAVFFTIGAVRFQFE
jgi:ABC-2 type transport system permease protein